jgi:hypothetical protein
MKRLLFAAILILVSASIASSLALACLECSAQQDTKPEMIKVEYDQQKDVTQITLNPMVLISRKFEELRFGAVTSYKGREKQKPDVIALIFLSLSKVDMNKYESARKLTILSGEQRFFVGETQRAKQSQNGLFIESMSTVIPFDTFLKISQARAVTFKLGTSEIKLSADQISMLRATVSYAMQ